MENCASTGTRLNDLPALVYTVLSERLFDVQGDPIPFLLRDKRNTQDDPLDVFLVDIIRESLPENFCAIRADKPLVSPDAVIARLEEYELLRSGGTDLDPRAIFGLEVKKVDLKQGKPSRATGMDYNSTPPCVTMRAYAEDGSEIRIPGFYLFIALQNNAKDETVCVHSMVLVTGAALNKDVELYDRITGARKKDIGLGTYGDGADRKRPMLIFSNPLGWSWTWGTSTLISERHDLENEQSIIHVRDIVRTVSADAFERFRCYRHERFRPCKEDVAFDPFPKPKKRTEKTSNRGKFVISANSFNLDSVGG